LATSISDTKDKFLPVLQTAENDNKKIYFMAVPPFTAVPCTTTPTHQGEDVWASAKPVPSAISFLLEVMKDEANKTAGRLQSEGQRLIGDLRTAIGYFPQKVSQDLQDQYSAFYSLRAVVHRDADELRALFARGTATAQRFPRVAQEFAELNAEIGRGNAPDEQVEAVYAVAKSQVVDLEAAVAAGEELVRNVNEILAAVDVLAVAQRGIQPSTNVGKLLAEREAFNKKAGALAARLATARDQAVGVQGWISAEVAKNVNDYLRNTRSAQEALGLRMVDYQRWKESITDVRNTIARG
jgi:hypothetical protein